MFMNNVIDRYSVFREVDMLNYTDKLYLLSYITNNLLKSDAKTKRNLLELKGLGRGLWGKQDINDYIQNERESWG